MASLDAVLADFRGVDDEMRLELLLDYARRLPPLPEAYVPLRDRGLNMVLECQAPVFFMVEIKEGRLRIRADVPDEAPLARSFVALLAEVFDGAPVHAVQSAPPDLLQALGLARLLGMQRRRGLSAIYRRLHHAVASRG